MSFDVYLARFVDGQPAPWDTTAIRALLAASGCSGPDDFGFWRGRLSDGAPVEVHAGDLAQDTSDALLSLHLRAPSLASYELVLALARAGQMVILTGEGPPILTSPQQAAHVPAELRKPDMPVCETGEQLEAIWSSEFEAWQRYRDQMVDPGRS